MLRSTLAPAVALALILALAPEARALTEYRTQVQTSIGSGNGVIIEQAGGLNVTSVSHVQTHCCGGATSEASASLSPTGYVPSLQVRPTNTGTRAQAVAWGVQGFRNTSGGEFSTSLFLNLTADLTGGNDLDARIYMFEEANFEFSIDPGTMLFECSCTVFSGFDAVRSSFQLLYGNFTGSIDETRQFDFTLEDGEAFYLWIQLLATADNVGQVDAFSTLSASFSDTSGLTPAQTAVPEPAFSALLALGLSGIVIRAGRPSAG